MLSLDRNSAVDLDATVTTRTKLATNSFLTSSSSRDQGTDLSKPKVDMGVLKPSDASHTAAASYKPPPSNLTPSLHPPIPTPSFALESPLSKPSPHVIQPPQPPPRTSSRLISSSLLFDTNAASSAQPTAAPRSSTEPLSCPLPSSDADPSVPPPPLVHRRTTSHSATLSPPLATFAIPQEDLASTPPLGQPGGGGKKRFRGFFASSKSELTSSTTVTDNSASTVATTSATDASSIVLPSLSDAPAPLASSLRQPRPSPATRPSTYFLPNSLKIPFISSSSSNHAGRSDSSPAQPPRQRDDEDDDEPLRPPSPASSFKVISARHVSTPPPPPQFEDLLPPRRPSFANHLDGGLPSNVRLPARSRTSSYDWRNSTAVDDEEEEEELVVKKVPVAAFRRRKSEVGLNGVNAMASPPSGHDERGSVEVIRTPIATSAPLPSLPDSSPSSAIHPGRSRGFVVASRQRAHGGSISSPIEPSSPMASPTVAQFPQIQDDPLPSLSTLLPHASSTAPSRPPRAISRPVVASPPSVPATLSPLPSSASSLPTNQENNGPIIVPPPEIAPVLASASPSAAPARPMLASSPSQSQIVSLANRRPSITLEQSQRPPSRSSLHSSSAINLSVPTSTNLPPVPVQSSATLNKPLSRYEAARAAKAPKPAPPPPPPPPVRRHYSSTEEESDDSDATSQDSISHPTRRRRRAPRPQARVRTVSHSFAAPSPALTKPSANVNAAMSSASPRPSNQQQHRSSVFTNATKPLISPPPGVDKIKLDRRLSTLR